MLANKSMPRRQSMPKRQSIHIEGLSHLTPIPVATRIGPLLVSSVITPFNPGTRQVPESIDDQYKNIFRHVGLMLETADATWADVAKMEFWVPDASFRPQLETLWLEKFPDAASRPSRHTHVGHGKSVRASMLAYVAKP